ncbi:MAG TPA: hypothetical protein VGK99_03305 [Acidobacteriota bacterium]|jgi:hypothetical protein
MRKSLLVTGLLLLLASMAVSSGSPVGAPALPEEPGRTHTTWGQVFIIHFFLA